MRLTDAEARKLTSLLKHIISRAPANFSVKFYYELSWLARRLDARAARKRARR